MKLLTIIIAFISFTFTAYSQPTIETYLANYTYPSKGGAIESIEEKYELLVDDVSPKPFRVLTKFDNNGYILSETRYNTMDAKQSETVWTYNSNKKLTNKTQTYFVNMIGWKMDETILKYNDTTGFLSEIQCFKNKVMQYSSRVYCDSYGLPYEVRVLDERGAYEGIERLSYSPNANIIRVMMLRASGKFSSLSVYPIDYSKPFQSGSIEKQYYPNGDVMLESLDYQTKTDQGYYYEYKYDANGNWIEKETYQVTLGKNNKVKDKKLEHRVIRSIKYY
ncbi:MAG TPA: hypothetical protein DIW31_03490 [Bacteroidales bacterium]|nr:hypothetical protein [Bacteroidales bacterium]